MGCCCASCRWAGLWGFQPGVGVWSVPDLCVCPPPAPPRLAPGRRWRFSAGVRCWRGAAWSWRCEGGLWALSAAAPAAAYVGQWTAVCWRRRARLNGGLEGVGGAASSTKAPSPGGSGRPWDLSAAPPQRARPASLEPVSRARLCVFRSFIVLFLVGIAGCFVSLAACVLAAPLTLPCGSGCFLLLPLALFCRSGFLVRVLETRVRCLPRLAES